MSELLALAEYMALVPVETLKQGALNTAPEPAQIMSALRDAIGIDPAFPHKVGGLFCLDTGAGLMQQRDVWALYTALRLTHLVRDKADARICEIGGGLGQVCHYATALGFPNYTLIDLPHVSLLQAFQLMRLYPEKRIALYGGDFDSNADIRVYPTFMFGRAPEKYFSVTINVDSLPEMGWDNALAYIEAARLNSSRFLSINQEAAAPLGFAAERQIQIPEIFARAGLRKPEYRFRSWVRRGYVESFWDLADALPPSLGSIDGYLDSVDSRWIAGWLRDSADSTNAPRTVEIRSDGKMLDCAVAGQFWPALQACGIGDGRHGFTLRTPIDLFDGKPHEVTALDRKTGLNLQTSPRAVHFPDIRTLGPRIAETLETDTWVIDSFSISKGVVTVTGWALAPSGNAAGVGFRVNGEEADNVTWPVNRRDIHQCYFYHPGSGYAGFAFRKDINQLVDRGATELALSFVDARSGAALTGYQTYYYGLNEESFALPDPDQRKRVTGTDDELLFRLGGYTLHRKIIALLAKDFPRALLGGAKVLDWGCGCGRLLRYFAADERWRGKLFGADIDGENIDWCRDNLPSVGFVKTALTPPTPYSDNQFDLIIGNSVFTHLGEEQQSLWLKELERITAPEGIVMVSVQAASELPRETFFAPEFETLFADGFLSSSVDDALAGVIDDPAYYRSAFHTHDYIRTVWGQHFDVLKILPQFANNVQDWVILRKPSA
jgi:SAM-dependent methyltransferase